MCHWRHSIHVVILLVRLYLQRVPNRSQVPLPATAWIQHIRALPWVQNGMSCDAVPGCQTRVEGPRCRPDDALRQ